MPRLTGQIAMWPGSIVSIPADWKLCDGTIGTPDLRDQFLEGAGLSLVPDDSGGNASHLHDVTTTHFHSLFPMYGNLDTGADFAENTDSQSPDLDTDVMPNLPKFHALCFIQCR